ncbi:IS1182 family transposase [Clostridium sp. HBUAS56017]|uniref:IS1182 family transposase n=1 Tax=Clostridium sp. HBUAS56017 TaxID=2571128 RepID=UPI0011778988|nr:IS1182 family transposase [Clostridium sp. HBUAS56017]
MKIKNIVPMHQIGFPIKTEIMIPKDDPVRLLYEVTEGLDYSKLYKAYSTKGRNPAIAPETLFRVLVYGYMNNLYSSRQLETACRRDINFMWLLQGQKAPDHNTIARFRSDRLSDCMNDLFNQLVIKLDELQEIGYKNVFIDGTKIEANANKYTFVWKKATNKFETKLQEKIRSTLEILKADFNLKFEMIDGKITVKYAEEILSLLSKIKSEENIDFVYGKGKRKSKLQKFTEQIDDFIEKQSKYDEYNSIFNGRNSFSKTDKDATFMHMKEDHMRNSQLKPGYNIQIGVEGEYIVGVDVSSERSDQLTFIPFLEKLNSNLPQKFQNVIADAGYESEENYCYLDKNKQNSYIKPQMYEKMKSKKFKNDISKRENMTYDEEEDFYICANGKRLIPIGTRNKKSKSGYESETTIYECLDCGDCPYRSKCNKSKGNKRLHVSKNFMAKREQSLINITTPEGKLLRMNRSIQIEGVFGVLKEDHRFRRFLTRGTKNIKIEFLLLSFGYNINKLWNKRKQNRSGILLHNIKIA